MRVRKHPQKERNMQMKNKIGYLSKKTIELLAKKAEEEIPSLNREAVDTFGIDEEDFGVIINDLNTLKKDRNYKICQKTYEWIFGELDWMYQYGVEKQEEEAKGVIET